MAKKNKEKTWEEIEQEKLFDFYTMELIRGGLDSIEKDPRITPEIQQEIDKLRKDLDDLNKK